MQTHLVTIEMFLKGSHQFIQKYSCSVMTWLKVSLKLEMFTCFISLCFIIVCVCACACIRVLCACVFVCECMHRWAHECAHVYVHSYSTITG